MRKSPLSAPDQQRILPTFDKDFGELVFLRGPPAGSGVVLFRITPDSPVQAAEVALALVADMQDSNRISLDGEENAVYMRLAAVKKVPHLEREDRIFGCQCTALWRMCERRNCFA